MAKFHQLDIEALYDIVAGDTGCWDGVQGGEAMATEWKEGDEAWPAGEKEFRGKPVEIAG